MSKDCGKIRQLSLIGENNSYLVEHITREREKNMRFWQHLKSHVTLKDGSSWLTT
tara:strand:+ start:2779 stop:2943 length:165 start_codon:yes stop_codon:yes gene_type:complete